MHCRADSIIYDGIFRQVDELSGRVQELEGSMGCASKRGRRQPQQGRRQELQGEERTRAQTTWRRNSCIYLGMALQPP